MREFKFLSKADLVDEHGYHHFFDVVQQEYIDSLKEESERLKKEVADYHQLQWQHDALIDEHERLKRELKEGKHA